AGNFEDMPGLLGVEVPDVYGVVGVSARQQSAIGTKGQGRHLHGVTVEQDDRLAGRGVPDPGRGVPARGHQETSARMPGEHGNAVGVALESARVPPRADFPQGDELVLAGGGEPLAVGAEGETADGTLVQLEPAQQTMAGRIPEAYQAVVMAAGQER